MSNDLAVSMAELEGESAELLPSRETLYCWRGGNHGGGHNISDSFNVTQIQQDGNTSQHGLVNISLLNGNLDGLF
jgi:hypothetical protein